MLGVWAALDWAFLGLKDMNLAVALSNARITVMTFATLALLLSAKWLHSGHSRYDVLLALPVAASLALIWGGMTYGAQLVSWGPRLLRNQLLYTLWALQQIAYVAGAAILVGTLYMKRKDLAAHLRYRFFGGAGSLFVFLGLWISTNIYNNVTQTSGVPWLSSLLGIPAAIILIAFVPLSSSEIGEVFAGVAAVEQRVSALYVFYRTGEPLVALGTSRNLPIEAEQLEGVLEIVGDFVETSMRKNRGYAVTHLRFDRLGIVAARGRYLIVAALYDGPVYDVLRAELLRTVQDFEARRSGDLQTLEAASRAAEDVADELSRLFHRPSTPAPEAARVRRM
jgi:hypothetical protein